MLIFPEAIPACEELSEEIYNPVIASTTEEATTITRAKTTKMPMSFSLKWKILNITQYEILINFFKQTRGGTIPFQWVHPLSKKTYTVRFNETVKSTFTNPCYYAVTFSLKEV